jgi:hypothetical protein
MELSQFIQLALLSLQAYTYAKWLKIVTGFSCFIPTHPAANFICVQDHSITVRQLVAILLLSKPGFNPWQATQAT